ncbi:MAG: hypothetical protein AAF380_01985 [Bacteroidota bacterium]
MKKITLLLLITCFATSHASYSKQQKTQIKPLKSPAAHQINQDHKLARSLEDFYYKEVKPFNQALENAQNNGILDVKSYKSLERKFRKLQREKQQLMKQNPEAKVEVNHTKKLVNASDFFNQKFNEKAIIETLENLELKLWERYYKEIRLETRKVEIQKEIIKQYKLTNELSEALKNIKKRYLHPSMKDYESIDITKFVQIYSESTAILYQKKIALKYLDKVVIPPDYAEKILGYTDEQLKESVQNIEKINQIIAKEEDSEKTDLLVNTLEDTINTIENQINKQINKRQEEAVENYIIELLKKGKDKPYEEKNLFLREIDRHIELLNFLLKQEQEKREITKLLEKIPTANPTGNSIEAQKTSKNILPQKPIETQPTKTPKSSSTKVYKTPKNTTTKKISQTQSTQPPKPTSIKTHKNRKKTTTKKIFQRQPTQTPKLTSIKAHKTPENTTTKKTPQTLPPNKQAPIHQHEEITHHPTHSTTHKVIPFIFFISFAATITYKNFTYNKKSKTHT